jgi:hypothetical protein
MRPGLIADLRQMALYVNPPAACALLWEAADILERLSPLDAPVVEEPLDFDKEDSDWQPVDEGDK